MSSLIKSSRVVLGDNSYNISSEITKPHHEYDEVIQDGAINKQDEHAMHAQYLVEEAERTALSILDDAEAKAQSILKSAEEDARIIEEEAVKKASEIYEKKREEAQDNGYSQGFDAGQSEAQVLIDEALMIKEEWELNKQQFIRRIETDIVNLCIDVVQNVLNREMSDQAYVLSLIKKGIDHLTYTVSLVVRVSEYDYDFVSSNKSKIMAMVDGVQEIDVKKDLSLEYGDCIIDTDTGSMDVGIHSQVEQVKLIFNKLLASD